MDGLLEELCAAQVVEVDWQLVLARRVERADARRARAIRLHRLACTARPSPPRAAIDPVQTTRPALEQELRVAATHSGKYCEVKRGATVGD